MATATLKALEKIELYNRIKSQNSIWRKYISYI